MSVKIYDKSVRSLVFGTDGVFIPYTVRSNTDFLLCEENQALMQFKNFHNCKDLKVIIIKRSDFENMIAALLHQTINKVREAIVNAKLDNGEHDIKEIILVGGSTRIPKIPQLLEQAFPHALIRVDVDPDNVVALGAAIQAAILNGDMSENISRMLLIDVIPLSLGIRASGGRMNVILKRNSTVPCSKSKHFSTKIENQSNVAIYVYEGEDVIAVNNNLLGSFKLINLPKMSRLVKRIIVKFDVDEDGILTVKATVSQTQIEESIEIEHNAGRLNEAEIRRMIANAEDALNF